MINSPLPSVFLCKLEELEDGSAKGFDPENSGSDTIFIVRQGEQVFGYKNSCPHIPEATLEWKKDAFLRGNPSKIFCSGHGALFNIEDGLCVQGACLGQSLQPLELVVENSEIYLRQ